MNSIIFSPVLFIFLFEIFCYFLLKNSAFILYLNWVFVNKKAVINIVNYKK